MRGSRLERLCERGMLLHHGTVRFDGPLSACLAEYETLYRPR